MVDRPISIEKYVIGSTAAAVPCATDDDIERELVNRLEPQVEISSNLSSTPAVVVSITAERQETSPSAAVTPSQPPTPTSAPALTPKFDLLWGQFHALEDFFARNPASARDRLEEDKMGKEQQDAAAGEKEKELEDGEVAVAASAPQGEGDNNSNSTETLKRLLRGIDERIGRLYARAPDNTMFVILSGRGPLNDVVGLQKKKSKGPWGREEEKVLEDAVNLTRQGMGWFCVKQ